MYRFRDSQTFIRLNDSLTIASKKIEFRIGNILNKLNISNKSVQTSRGKCAICLCLTTKKKKLHSNIF